MTSEEREKMERLHRRFPHPEEDPMGYSLAFDQSFPPSPGADDTRRKRICLEWDVEHGVEGAKALLEEMDKQARRTEIREQYGPSKLARYDERMTREMIAEELCDATSDLEDHKHSKEKLVELIVHSEFGGEELAVVRRYFEWVGMQLPAL